MFVLLAQFHQCSPEFPGYLGTGMWTASPSTSGFRSLPLSLAVSGAVAVNSGKSAAYTEVNSGDLIETWLLWFKEGSQQQGPQHHQE